MFDKKTLLNHITNNSNHNAMTQAGMKAGFGTNNNQQQQPETPKQDDEYEEIKEGYYDQ